MDKTLKELYSGPVKSQHFLSANPQQLYKAAKKVNNKNVVTLPKVRSFLQSQDVHTLNRSVHRTFKRNHYYVYYINDLWQIDLADVSQYAKQNDNYRYLMTVVDVLTKFAIVHPLRSKTALEVTKAFQRILTTSGRGIPKAVSSDKGKEFKNKHFSALLTGHGIKQQFLLTTSLFKASVVEIFNRTLKTKLFKYLTTKASNNHRYIDVLQDIVNSYNDTVHSVTGMKPSAVRPEHVPYIYHQTHKKHRGEAETRTQHLQPGEYVRVVRKQNTFQQTFAEKWTREIFIVTKVINKKPYKLYKLKDFNDVELSGKFYDAELQRIVLPPNHVIKIIQANKIHGKKKYLVLLADGRKVWKTNTTND